MPINENAVNAALAEALSAHNLHATPEQTRTRTGMKRCDVQVRRNHGDRYYTALECKIGQNAPRKKAAVKDAQRWLRQSDCWNAVALCYPKQVAEPRKTTLAQVLESTNDLLMVRVDQGGPTSRWHKGGLTELAKLADDIGANETYAITDTLSRAIKIASDQISANTSQELADALELPWKLNKERIDPRPARIACLIIANMALLHNRMRLNLTRTVAVFSDEPTLGSAFVPVTPKGGNNEALCKAWCVWLNSTPGTIAFLNIRQKNLSYPHFSIDGLRSLPIPNPDRCDINRLVAAYNQYANETLLPLPLMDKDPVRRALDDAVLEAVPGLSNTDVVQWKNSIPLEPSVNNKKEPFQLR